MGSCFIGSVGRFGSGFGCRRRSGESHDGGLCRRAGRQSSRLPDLLQPLHGLFRTGRNGEGFVGYKQCHQIFSPPGERRLGPGLSAAGQDSDGEGGEQAGPDRLEQCLASGSQPSAGLERPGRPALQDGPIRLGQNRLQPVVADGYPQPECLHGAGPGRSTRRATGAGQRPSGSGGESFAQRSHGLPGA